MGGAESVESRYDRNEATVRGTPTQYEQEQAQPPRPPAPEPLARVPDDLSGESSEEEYEDDYYEDDPPEVEHNEEEVEDPEPEEEVEEIEPHRDPSLQAIDRQRLLKNHRGDVIRRNNRRNYSQNDTTITVPR